MKLYKMIALKRTVLLFALLLVFPGLCLAWQGKCVGVSDGDTITVMYKGKGERIRLYGVDCPEKRQDFGNRAKQFTSGMVFGKIVDVVPLDKDRYERIVGMVYVNGSCLNEELVRNGFAWVYKQYCTNKPVCDKWRALELEASKKNIGLWSMSNPIPPWDFRHGKPTAKKQTDPEKGLGYHGNAKSKVFHKPGCRYYDCKNCTAVFQSRDEAINAGYRPCNICRP